MKRVTLWIIPLVLLTLDSNAEPLRIMQFNGEWLVYSADETTKDPWGDDFGNNEHFERVAGVIETLQPDIVNLCEITNKESVDFLVDILHAKNLTDYKGYHIESSDTGTGQDIAVISKIELKTVDGTKLKHVTKADGDEYRMDYTWVTGNGIEKSSSTSISKNILYYIDFNHNKIGFLGLHLKAFPNDEKSNAQRNAQSKIAAKIIQNFIVDKGYKPIVLGDFNDYDPDVRDVCDNEPMTDVLKTIKDYDAGQSGPELFNAVSKIVRKYDRYTAYWDKNRNDRIDGGDGYSVIDHVLIDKSLQGKIDRCFIDHGHGRDVSDHWPIIVDLNLN